MEGEVQRKIRCLRMFRLSIAQLQWLSEKMARESPTFNQRRDRLGRALDVYFWRFNAQRESIEGDIIAYRRELLKRGVAIPDDWIALPTTLAVKIDPEARQYVLDSPIIEQWKAIQTAIGVREERMECSALEEPRLSVDLGRGVVTLDGTTREVASQQALRWIKVLSEHPGKWISGSELEAFDRELDGVRTDRLIPYLPKPVAELVHSEPGRGSRLILA